MGILEEAGGCYQITKIRACYLHMQNRVRIKDSSKLCESFGGVLFSLHAGRWTSSVAESTVTVHDCLYCVAWKIGRISLSIMCLLCFVPIETFRYAAHSAAHSNSNTP